MNISCIFRDGGSGWASRVMALRCFRLVGPEYALALCLFQIVNNDDSIAPNLILMEFT